MVPSPPETAFEQKRLDVLHRAALVFAEDGFHQTSVNSLAARLGVSKPVLYYYAKNKDDLLYQCDQIVRDALFKAMESTDRTKISGMGKVRHFFNHYAEIMCGDFGRCLALVDHRALSRETRQKTGVFAQARRGSGMPNDTGGPSRRIDRPLQSPTCRSSAFWRV